MASHHHGEGEDKQPKAVAMHCTFLAMHVTIAAIHSIAAMQHEARLHCAAQRDVAFDHTTITETHPISAHSLPSSEVPASPYGTLPPAASPAARKPISLPRLMDMHARGEKITMLTAYDATFAAMADSAGIDCILVGDSLGMVCQGRHSTVGVSLEEMRYHTACVSRGVRRVQGTAWVVADLPFGSYQQSPEQALASAVVLMEAGAHMVKLEGGGWTTDTVHFLTQRGIPVCAHLGLTPQTVHALGGYRVQGRGDDAGNTLRQEAQALADAGAQLLVLEMVPTALASALTQALPHCATIGIGAGAGTAGQVLVLHDMLGMNIGKMPKFVRNFMQGQNSIAGAMQAYVQAVKQGQFPVDAEHAWN